MQQKKLGILLILSNFKITILPTFPHSFLNTERKHEHKKLK